MAAKRVRLKDVAERAGVAVNTASTILNRRPNSWASKETAERVFQAAKDLGYTPNRAAVALQSGRFHAIGLLVADLNNPYYTTFADILAQYLETRGYDLVIESWRTDVTREKKLLSEITHRNVDAVVAFVSDLEHHPEIFEDPTRFPKPFVALCMPSEASRNLDAIMPDFSKGLKDAVDSLHELGHRRFVFLAARAIGQRVGERPHIVEEALRHLPETTFETVACGASISEAREAIAPVLSRPAADRPTAVVALNDLSAIGAMRAAVLAGLAVPADLSVVGVDNIPLAAELPVSLSTVEQPIEAMALKAAEIALARVEEDEPGPVRSKLFPTRFLPRESIGPAAS